MNINLFYDNNLTDYGILIGCGLILGCSLYYLIWSNYTPIPSENIEALTNEELETIMNENIEPISNTNIDNYITDSDFETDSTSDYQSTLFDSDSDSDSSSDFENILNDLDLFFMPDVDFNIISIEELKFFEFTSLYSRQIIEHSISDAEIMEFLSWFTPEQLATNWINDVFVYLICLV